VTGDVDFLIRVDVADLTGLPGRAHITSYVVTSTAIERR
jgi:hypothetical protein